MVKNASFSINNRSYDLSVISKKFKRGKNKTLFDSKISNNEKFLNDGFIIEQFPEDWFFLIKSSVENLILKKIKKHTDFKDLINIDLKNYHKYVDDKSHIKIVNEFRGGYLGTNGIDLKSLGIGYKELDKFINDKIKSDYPLSCVFDFFGFKLKKFWIRIVRPNKKDNNPPHRDTHLRYFKLKDNVNIYLPLAGSNTESSLPLIPRSHLDMENECVVSESPCCVNGVNFIAPCIVHRDGGLDMITPNPKEKQIMIFTPNIIHGGGININDDITRVSLELRFFK